MSPKGQPVERLEKRLARVARDLGLDQERLRRWVSFLALCGVLEKAVGEGVAGWYHLKGGVALELRFGVRARATKDLDLGLDSPRANRVDILRRCLDLGFDEFTFRVKAQTRDMGQADAIRASVAVLYRTRAWQTIEVDLGAARRPDTDLVEPQVTGLAELGLPVVSPVRCLGLCEQAAQKIHACTGPHSAGRARDVLDVLLIDMMAGLDDAQLGAATRRVFDERSTHAFPLEFRMPAEWRPEVEALAAELGFPHHGAAEIENQFQSLLGRLAASTS